MKPTSYWWLRSLPAAILHRVARWFYKTSGSRTKRRFWFRLGWLCERTMGRIESLAEAYAVRSFWLGNGYGRTVAILNAELDDRDLADGTIVFTATREPVPGDDFVVREVAFLDQHGKILSYRCRAVTMHITHEVRLDIRHEVRVAAIPRQREKHAVSLLPEDCRP